MAINIPKTVSEWIVQPNGILVVTARGWAFKASMEDDLAIHMRSFDGYREAFYAVAQKRLQHCYCRRCKGHSKLFIGRQQ